MLIWSAGTRVVPFTFVPVSARVPACQQSARRWVISTQPGGRAAGRVDSLPGSPDSDGCGLPPRETALLSAEGRARHARPRGSEEDGNVQVRRVETAGDRRFLACEWLGNRQVFREPTASTRELDSRNTTG